MSKGLGFNTQEGIKNQRESGKEKGSESSCGSQVVIFHDLPSETYLYWGTCWLRPWWRSRASHCRECLLIWFIWSCPVMRLELHNWMHRIAALPALNFQKASWKLTEKLQEGMILVGEISGKKWFQTVKFQEGSALGFCSRRTSDWIYLAHAK